MVGARRLLYVGSASGAIGDGCGALPPQLGGDDILVGERLVDFGIVLPGTDEVIQVIELNRVLGQTETGLQRFDRRGVQASLPCERSILSTEAGILRIVY